MAAHGLGQRKAVATNRQPVIRKLEFNEATLSRHRGTWLNGTAPRRGGTLTRAPHCHGALSPAAQNKTPSSSRMTAFCVQANL
jgi:hypothetical protein